jgi:uncharacterized protein YycO
MKHACINFLLLAILLSTACAGATKSVVSPDEALEGSGAAKIRVQLQHGDWLVIRGFTPANNMVATVTNMPLSHAAIYDQENDQVVEADGDGVHLTPLTKFVETAQRLLIIRPIWAGPETSRGAVNRAKSWLGAGYNFTGLVGLNMPKRYYCTQLVFKAYEPYITTLPNPVPHIIAPGQMYHWGRIIFDTGP